MSSQFAVRLLVAQDQYEETLARLAETTTGIVEEELTGALIPVTAYFDDRETACAWGSPVEVAAEDWSSNWQAAWEPFTLGTRWFLAPPWSGAVTPAGRLRLTMTPGPVFGNGDHPTTQMCLELLEEAVQSARRVIDVGTGTGILSVAARMLGASAVVACDIDPLACALAAEAGVPVWQGSSDACRTQAFDLAIANLPGGLLNDLLPELRRLAPRLLVSGYLDSQQAVVERGAQVVARRERGEWRAALLSYPEDRST